MTPLRPSPLLRVPSPERTGTADRTPATSGFDGVVGDVIITVLLAAVVAAVVGALLFLLWHALPSASRIAALTFAMAVPPPRRRRAEGAAGSGDRDHGNGRTARRAAQRREQVTDRGGRYPSSSNSPASGGPRRVDGRSASR